MRLPFPAAVFAAAVLVAALTAGPARAGSSVTVSAGTNYFCDPSYENGVCITNITAGDTVIWNVVDGIHTVTQCDANYVDCPPVGGFDSGIVPEGNSFSRTFDSPGAYSYYCSLHPNDMRGVVNVTAATPTPAPSHTPSPAPEPGTTPTPVPAGGANPSATPVTVPSAGGPPASRTAIPLAALLALAAVGLAVGCVAALATWRRKAE